ncbi:MAG: PAS domain S-box protein [Desulfobacterales bacterium]|nr:PAS domain S-box protein [Desulfobacterales bacterium]
MITDNAKNNVNFYKTLLDDMVTFVALLDRTGTVIFVNNTPLILGGLTLEEVKGNKFWDTRWWSHSNETRNKIKDDVQVCATGSNLIHEIQILTADNSLIWIEYSMHPVFDEEGNVEYLVPEGRDITDRKLGEFIKLEQYKGLSLSADIGNTLAQKASLNEKMQCCCKLVGKHFDAALVRIWLVNEMQNTLELKASAGGSSESDVIFNKIDISRDNKIGNIAIAKSPRIIRQIDDLQLIDKECVMQDIASFAGNPFLIEDKVIGVIGIYSKMSLSEIAFKTLIGIADQIALGVIKQKNEDSLFESETMFRNLIEDTVDWIWEIDETGNFAYSSPRVYDLLGYHPKEIVGKTPFEFMPIEEAKRIEAIFQEISYKQESFRNIENTYVHKDSNFVILETSGRPIFDIQGKLSGYRCIDRDITERKNSEKKLRETEEQLKQAQKMESIGTLAGGIAHDFNNILSAIVGYTELALLGINNQELIAQDLDHVLKAAKRATSLVRQILTFSKKKVETKQAIQVSHIVDEALNLLRSSIPATIDIKQSITTNSFVLADPTQIHQIVINICTNAYHSMKNTGGIIGVDLKEVDLSTTEKTELDYNTGRYIQLTISDTGAGMDAETKEKIFEPYYTTKGLGEGTGLGLAVVHGIVASSRGFIDVISEPKHGTAFHIYLPVYTGVVEQSLNKKEIQLIRGNETIMFVDDEVMILDIIKRKFTQYGYKIHTYSNGEQAYQEFSRDMDKYDIIITDMTMPHMTGADLTLKILEICPEIPVILCTGHSELVNRDKALNLGAKAFCEKPLNTNQLLLTVRKVLDGNL